MSRVSVVGLGKLGSPLAAVYSSKGHHVIGLDLNERYVKEINAGRAPVEEAGLQELITKYPFRATTSYEEAVRGSDTSFVIVPTPSAISGRFMNDYLLEAVTAIGHEVAKKTRYHLVVICSTTTPGSVSGEIQETLEVAAGRGVGNNLGLCYCPEFIALGTVVQNMLDPEMVLIGESDRTAGAKLERLVRSIASAPVQRMSATNAEVAKIAVNTYVAMKISYANLLGEICENLDGGDAHVVANAVGLDRRIGRKYLTPATAYGGPCFPRDTNAFAALARDCHAPRVLADATDLINRHQALRLTKKICALTKKDDMVAILGTSYKPGTHITEESPGLTLQTHLELEGRKTRLHDPSHRTGPPLLKGVQVGIIMQPCAEYEAVVPHCFVENPELIIIDCWDISKRGPWDDSHVIRIGRN